MKEFHFRSNSPGKTRALAARLGQLLASGDVVALKGELGSGKTEFVHGLAQGLGVPSQVPVASPSFTLAHEYPGRCTLTHIDLYRLEDLPPEMLPEMEEYLYGSRVAVIEWAERLETLLPEDHLEVLLAVTGKSRRDLTFISHGPRSRHLLEELSGTTT